MIYLLVRNLYWIQQEIENRSSFFFFSISMWDRTVKHFQLGRRMINMHLVPMIFPSYSHSDIDECSSTNECHLDATCANTKGSYHCTCKDGFEGDGKNCTGKTLLKSITTKSLHKKNLQKGKFFCHDFPNSHGTSKRKPYIFINCRFHSFCRHWRMLSWKRLSSGWHL